MHAGGVLAGAPASGSSADARGDIWATRSKFVDWDEQRGWSVVWSDEARMTVAHCSCTPLRWELDVRMIFGRTRWLVGRSQIFKTAEYSAIFD
jgi:hypothetical protein